MRRDVEPMLPNTQFVARRTVRHVFDAWAREGRADAAARSHLRTARYALATIDPPEDGRLVDLGCGNGYAGDFVRSRHPNLDVVSIDVSPGMLRRVRDLFPRHHAVRADAAHLPLRTATANGVFSMEALYYLRDPGLAIQEAHRVLRPAGSLDIVIDFFEENPHSRAWPAQMGIHLTRWTEERWREALKAAGFHGSTTRRLLPDLTEEDALARAVEDDDWNEWARNVGSLHVHGER